MRRLELFAFTLLLGCGDDGVHHLADAPPAGSADAPAADAPPIAPTTVKTLQRERYGTDPDGPVAGVVVQVVNPDLSLGPAATTDATGIVTFAAIQPGSSITAMYPEDADDTTVMVTVAGVAPGAHLVLGDHYFEPTFADADPKSLTVSWPGQGIPVNVYTPCGGSSVGSGEATATFDVNPGCAGAAMPVVLFADFGSGLRQSGYLPAEPFTSGSAALTTWHAFPDDPNFTLSATGFAATDSVIYANERTVYMPVARRGYDYTYSAGNSFELDGSGAGSAIVRTTLDGLRTTATLDTFTSLSTPNGYADHHSFRVGAADATSIAFAATKMPYLGQHLTLSVADHTLAWIESPGATSHGDALIANIDWFHTDTTTDTNHYTEWTIIAPPPTTPLVSWAGYPAALAAHLPTVDDSLSTPTLALVDIGAVTSYADAIALPEWQLTQNDAAMTDGDVASADVAGAGGGSGKRAARTRRVSAAQAKAYAIAHPSHRAR